MYIDTGPSGLIPVELMIMPPIKAEYDWRMTLVHVWDLLWRFTHGELEVNGVWNDDVAPLIAWMTDKFSDVYSFVKIYAVPFHIAAWSIFFGPIIILVPLLLFLELVILALMYLGFLSHGIYLGSLEGRFHGLKEYFMDARESLFSMVEYWTSVFNTWTSKHPSLLMFRLLCFGLGIFTLIGIWTNWGSGVS